MGFWPENLLRSIEGTWSFMEGFSLMNAILIWVISVFVARLWRGRDSAREWVIDGLIGFAGTFFVGTAVFLFYAVLVSPSHIYTEQKNQIELLTNRIGWLTEFDASLMRDNKSVMTENASLKTALLLSYSTNKSQSEMLAKYNNQSPILQNVQASNVTVNTDYSSNNRGIIIGSIANSSVQFITTNIFTPDPMKTAWDEGLKHDLVEAFNRFQNAVSTGDHEDAFEKSKEVIDTLESAPANFIQELPPSAKSGIYLMAYYCADGVGSNQLAVAYAQKAFDFVQNDPTKTFLSMALQNLAIENAANATPNFIAALDLNRKAITYYESIKNPVSVAKLMDVSAAHFYHFGAQMALINGVFNEAERYAFKAAQIDPSGENQKLLSSTLSYLGYAVIRGEGTNNFEIFLMKPPNPQLLRLNTNNEIINFDGNFKAIFHN